jgi:hypothetical protein
MSAGRHLRMTLAAITLAATTAVTAALTTTTQVGPTTARPVVLTAVTARADLAKPGKPAVLVPRRANWKKGVGTWAFPGVGQALRKSGASWYYTWSVWHTGIPIPRGVAFVPMIWGAADVNATELNEARHEGNVLLGFNEPDLSRQANMSVSQALSLWPQLMATGMRLGSPSVAGGGATPGSWLDQFMSGAAADHYRVNFITLHWYGADFRTRVAVNELKDYITAVWNRYQKPIWLTEFALWRFFPFTFASPRQQAAFVTAATTMLERLPYVWRYAWFALPASRHDGSAGLFSSGAVATAAGRAFEKVDSSGLRSASSFMTPS